MATQATRILVTGANGFVGRCLAAELVRRGYLVRSAVRDAARTSGVAGEAVAVGSLDAHTDWSGALEGVHAIVHLAARVHVMKETAADPLEAFRAVNVRATEALAQAAAGRGARRFVFVSSIKVNGEATRGGEAYTPDDPPAPTDPYGISKWEAERALHAIGEATGLEVCIVRPPLVYGPGVGGNFLRLLKLVRRGMPLPFGAVENRRSMIYNANLADALIACAVHSKAAGKTYLVSDGHDLSTRELVRELGAALGRRARLVPVPAAILRAAGVFTGMHEEVERLIGSLAVDSTCIRTELAWHAPRAVNEGLRETARWFLTQSP